MSKQFERKAKLIFRDLSESCLGFPHSLSAEKFFVATVIERMMENPWPECHCGGNIYAGVALPNPQSNSYVMSCHNNGCKMRPAYGKSLDEALQRYLLQKGA